MPYFASRRRLLSTLLTLSVFPSVTLAQARPYVERDDVLAWARSLSKEQGIPLDWLIKALSQAKHNRTAERIMRKPKLTATAQPKNWYAHKESILTLERTYMGERFLKNNADAFKRAYAQYGVSPAVIASIIGIESAYGRKMGQHKVLDVLMTLSFDYTRRETFFKKELAAFLSWCHRSKLAPAQQLGSFAGAVGMCQFMPSNILKLGVDFDKDGRIDLRNSPTDAIGSVARYLRNAGWKDGLALNWPCRANDAIAKQLKSGGVRTNTTIKQAKRLGVRIAKEVEPPEDTPVLLARLPIVTAEGQNAALWRLGSRNYQAILSYNRSYFYAESVVELSKRLEPTVKKLLA